MDVLLIQPRHKSSRRAGNYGVMPPMMLYYLATPLIEAGFSVDVLDLSVYEINNNRLKEYIHQHSPRIIGFTAATEDFNSALKTIEHIRDVADDIKIVFGGPHVSFQSKETMSHNCIDFVIRGEGEIAFKALVQKIMAGDDSYENISGLTYRKNDSIIENPRNKNNDINTYPIPNRESLNINRYQIPGAIQTSRGCPFQCHFCTAAAMAGGKYRFRDMENIKKEIDYLVLHHGINYLGFIDYTMTGFPIKTREICNHILKMGYSLRWTCESRVDVADRELLELMAQAGCHTIQFGFESANVDILQSIKKKITPQQIESAVSLCLQNGIIPNGNFMIGFPEETRQSIKETCTLAKKLKQMGAVCELAIMTPFPGTYFYNNAQSIGITIHSQNWDDYALENPIVSTKNFSLKELRRIYTDARTELSEISSQY